MKNSKTPSGKTIKEAVLSYEDFQDEVLIIEFDSSSINDLRKYTPLNPSRIDAYILIGITEGEAEVQIDYITYRADKNSIIFIMPTHIINFVNGSKDLRSWVLSVSASYMETIPYSKQQPAIISYMQLKKDPLTRFDADEYADICADIDLVRNKVCRRNHLFHKEAVNSALRLFFIDLGNFYLSKREHYILPTLSRKEELFTDFQNLLKEHCTKQHNVRFYADRLCITSQYLSSILKEQSGMSACQWIQAALITEAKGILKNPRTNVQQVADELNFPDQSTFGKFFKKHTGMSPLAYRKS